LALLAKNGFKVLVKEISKIWILVLAVVLAAGVVAFVAFRRSAGEIEIHVIDAKTGVSLSNVTATISEAYRPSFVASCRLIPMALRTRVLTHTFTVRAVDGRFRIKRISGPGILAWQALDLTVGGLEVVSQVRQDIGGVHVFDYSPATPTGVVWHPIAFNSSADGSVTIECVRQYGW